MWVMGEECCDGSSRSSEAKEFQYCCSDVIVEGPFGSRTCCSGCTSAAIVVGGVCGIMGRKLVQMAATLAMDEILVEL
jgi:hypothetical protein